MRRVILGAGGLSRVRWQISPLSELASLIRLGLSGQRHPVQGWVRPRVLRALADPRAQVVRALAPAHGRGPFPVVTPSPLRGQHRLADELARVEALVTDEVVASCEWSDVTPETEARLRPYLDAGRLGPRVAEELAWLWDELMAADWPALLAAMQHEVARRSSEVATDGMAEVLEHLSPRVHWLPVGELLIDKPWPGTFDLTDAGLVLVPSMFGTDEPLTGFDDEQAPMLVYSVRPDHEPHDTKAARARLLGRTRAEVLDALDDPRTTSELSRRLGLPLSTVSTHLGILHRAGMVTRRRQGRSVVYHRVGLPAAS
jgi:hypothetical protein